MVTFDATYNDSEIYKVNERLTHFHTPSQLIKYYANYYEYHQMPTLEQFLEDEQAQRAFHMERGQKHLLFIFPENKQLPEELLDYAKKDYELCKMELYQLSKGTSSQIDDNISYKMVTEDDVIFKDFLEVCREGELEYGEDFVHLKEKTHLRDLDNPMILQLVGYMDNVPVGKIEAIVSESFIEIDDFYVKKAYRSKGVGLALQQAVWQFARNKTVILIADGNDTPREMYQKQGYEKVSERYELLHTGE